MRTETESRHWYLGLGRPGPASDMPSRAGLRLRARPVMPSRLFTGADEPHAAHRLLQSNGPTSTPCEHPNPPGCACEATPEWQLDPWQGRASRAVSNQGSPGDGSPYRLPHGDRSPYGFTQFRIDPDTPCRDADTVVDWMVDGSDLRWRSLPRGGSARLGTPDRGLATTEAVCR